MIAPTNEGGIYYTGPTDDFSRPGRMWWSVPEGVEEFDTWRELTTVYHEGVPGHHLQIAQAVYNRAELNSLASPARRRLGSRRGLGAVRRTPDGAARLPRRIRPTGSGCSTASGCAPPESCSTSACTSPSSAPTVRDVGLRLRARRSCCATSTCPTSSCGSRSTAISAGPVRRRRTRSASASGSSCATRSPSARATTSRSSRSTSARSTSAASASTRCAWRSRLTRRLRDRSVVRTVRSLSRRSSGGRRTSSSFVCAKSS